MDGIKPSMTPCANSIDRDGSLMSCLASNRLLLMPFGASDGIKPALPVILIIVAGRYATARAVYGVVHDAPFMCVFMLRA